MSENKAINKELKRLKKGKNNTGTMRRILYEY